MKDVDCMFPSLKRCKLKLIYQASECTMEDSLFCKGWDGYRTFYELLFYFLCDVVQAVACVSHTVYLF